MRPTASAPETIYRCKRSGRPRHRSGRRRSGVMRTWPQAIASRRRRASPTHKRGPRRSEGHVEYLSRLAVAAGELAAELFELRVRGQAAGRCVRVGVRACGNRGARRRRRGARFGIALIVSCSGFSFLRLDDLALVRLEPRARFGVLTLPLGLLLFVPWQPLVGLGVETFGVDVVAGLVV